MAFSDGQVAGVQDEPSACGKDLLPSHSRHAHPERETTAQEQQHLRCPVLPQSYTAKGSLQQQCRSGICCWKISRVEL